MLLFSWRKNQTMSDASNNRMQWMVLVTYLIEQGYSVAVIDGEIHVKSHTGETVRTQPSARFEDAVLSKIYAEETRALKSILAISHDRALLETRRLLLKTLGHHVESILDFRDLTSVLQEQACDVAVVGFSVPAAEKRRVAAQIREHRPDCKIVEIFQMSPEIANAAAYVRNEDGPDALLSAVRAHV